MVDLFLFLCQLQQTNCDIHDIAMEPKILKLTITPEEIYKNLDYLALEIKSIGNVTLIYIGGIPYQIRDPRLPYALFGYFMSIDEDITLTGNSIPNTGTALRKKLFSQMYSFWVQHFFPLLLRMFRNNNNRTTEKGGQLQKTNKSFTLNKTDRHVCNENNFYELIPFCKAPICFTVIFITVCVAVIILSAAVCLLCLLRCLRTSRHDRCKSTDEEKAALITQNFSRTPYFVFLGQKASNSTESLVKYSNKKPNIEQRIYSPVMQNMPVADSGDKTVTTPKVCETFPEMKKKSNVSLQIRDAENIDENKMAAQVPAVWEEEEDLISKGDSGESYFEELSGMQVLDNEHSSSHTTCMNCCKSKDRESRTKKKWFPKLFKNSKPVNNS